MKVIFPLSFNHPGILYRYEFFEPIVLFTVTGSPRAACHLLATSFPLRVLNMPLEVEHMRLQPVSSKMSALININSLPPKMRRKEYVQRRMLRKEFMVWVGLLMASKARLDARLTRYDCHSMYEVLIEMPSGGYHKAAFLRWGLRALVCPQHSRSV
ncbi:hypothetical protein NEOLEDRAFT_1139323 [Neolentinus lepideus HHB14362 ss-1]|uniref:Uncharacterized protein n=1 Tax=Neolentinus lepideus HHB14362 ss-1 TaxID=1314782 RepID=A0A165PTH7_9AGAM|nr:hypothetical protein NEOLEDRAFT_1139323 [Neolentinus lepideus HHB14362 ss-1]